MCLGVPGRVVEWIDRESIMAQAWIEFDGLRKECSLACVPEAEVGDFVIIHAGVAICRIDADRAAEMLTLLEQMDAGYLDELDASP
jgi:hydrogenase expression/formation protein HypC